MPENISGEFDERIQLLSELGRLFPVKPLPVFDLDSLTESEDEKIASILRGVRWSDLYEIDVRKVVDYGALHRLTPAQTVYYLPAFIKHHLVFPTGSLVSTEIYNLVSPEEDLGWRSAIASQLNLEQKLFFNRILDFYESIYEDRVLDRHKGLRFTIA